MRGRRREQDVWVKKMFVVLSSLSTRTHIFVGHIHTRTRKSFYLRSSHPDGRSLTAGERGKDK